MLSEPVEGKNIDVTEAVLLHEPDKPFHVPGRIVAARDNGITEDYPAQVLPGRLFDIFQYSLS